MSYILDALKKAESERERGGIPGLSTPQANHSTYIDYGSGQKPWLLMALAAVSLIALAAAFWVWRQSAAVAAAPVSVQTEVVPQFAAQKPLPVPKVNAKVVPVVPARPQPTAREPAVGAAAQAVAPAAVPTAAPVLSASGGTPMLHDLPDTLRRQIPALHISGAVYSDSPPQWTLIINDQIMGKGSQVAPDVRLEEISASSAVFNFKGQRFRMER